MYIYVHLNMKNNLTPDKSILQQIESSRRVGRKRQELHFDTSTGNPMSSQKKEYIPNINVQEYDRKPESATLGSIYICDEDLILCQTDHEQAEWCGYLKNRTLIWQLPAREWYLIKKVKRDSN